jgi:flagellar biosynthetic protein FliR
VPAVNGLDLALGQQVLVGFILALARTAGFVLTAPPFNTRAVPPRIRAGVAITLAIPLSSFLETGAPDINSTDLVFRMLVQLVAGVTLGALVNLAVAAVQMLGDLIDVVGGFTMTLGMDPLLLVQTSVMGRLHQLVAITLLFGGDGHLLVLQGLSRSVQLSPTPSADLGDVARVLAADLTTMFVAAIQVAAPVIGALFVADVALGLLTRAAPALNAFALAFPLKILLSLLLVGLVLLQVPTLLTGLLEQVVSTMLRLSGG